MPGNKNQKVIHNFLELIYRKIANHFLNLLAVIRN